MKIAIEVTGSQERLLAQAAARLNVPAARVLGKNRELYERLR